MTKKRVKDEDVVTIGRDLAFMIADQILSAHYGGHKITENVYQWAIANGGRVTEDEQGKDASK